MVLGDSYLELLASQQVLFTRHADVEGGGHWLLAGGSGQYLEHREVGERGVSLPWY